MKILQLDKFQIQEQISTWDIYVWFPKDFELTWIGIIYIRIERDPPV